MGSEGARGGVKATEITASRGKRLLLFAGCLAFVATALLLDRHARADWGIRSAELFFGLGSLIALWMLIRPQRILLDGVGFTLAGGLVRTPRRIAWADIDRFVVYRMPRGGKMVGWRYRPDRARGALARAVEAMTGVDGALPGCWPGKPEALVATLEQYRAAATGRS